MDNQSIKEEEKSNNNFPKIFIWLNLQYSFLTKIQYIKKQKMMI